MLSQLENTGAMKRRKSGGEAVRHVRTTLAATNPNKAMHGEFTTMAPTSIHPTQVLACGAPTIIIAQSSICTISYDVEV